MLELRTLGALDLSRPDGTAVQSVLAQPKRAALLVYLAVSRPGGYQRRDTLLPLFWPSRDEASARHSLSQALHRLRQSFGGGALEIRGSDEVGLAKGAVACDAVSFLEAIAESRWAEALDLYRGDFLAGVHVNGADGFERWMEEQRARLREQAARAAWSLAGEQTSRGALVEAEATATRALRLAPTDESTARMFMGQLAAAGAPAAAVGFYEKLRAVLADEFELEPSSKTLEALEAVRNSEAVMRRHHGAAGTTSVLKLPAAGVETAAARVGRVRWPRGLRWGTAVLAVAGGLTLGGWVVKQFGAAADGIQSLVVLPLDNLTGDPRQEYFVEGMHDALIGELAKASALRVISRTSTMRYKGSGKSVPEIARALAVDAVVEGSVCRTGETVQIQLQLIGVRPERHLWTQTYERNLRDLPALHQEVALAIAGELEVTIAPREAARQPTSHAINPAAYEAWLKGSYHASRRTAADLHACVAHGKEAAAIDPTYAPAYQLLADCYNVLAFVTTSPPREMFENAKAAARRALALDESLAGAHAALAYALACYDWDWSGAERAYRRALQLNPALEGVRGDYGFFLAWIGRYDEAMAQARRAEQLNPVSPQASLRVAMVAYIARRYDEAIAEARRAIDMDPTFMFGYDRLHWAYDAKGMYDEAVAAAERGVELAGPNDLRRRGFLAHAYGLAGRHDAAQAILDELLMLERQTYVPPTALAAAYIGLGDTERALRWLERGYDGRDGDMVMLKAFPLWDPLRGEPRFEALVRRMRFPQ